MTPTRARYILDTMGPFGAIRYAFPLRPSGDNGTHADGITWEENRAVHRLWETMPGTSCYVDALQAIARSEPIPAEIPTDADGVPLHLPEADPLTIV